MESSGAVESMAPFMRGREERIFSIMVSASELEKLDLSNILLFPAKVDCSQNGLKDQEEEIDQSSHTRQESFWFPVEAEEGVSMAPVQVFKSVGVIEAEKYLMEQNRGNNDRCLKSVSMDETHLDRFESLAVAETKKIRKAQYGSTVHDKLQPPSLPIKTSRAEEDQAEAEEIMRIKPGIDLESSHASKFLNQVMPWELQASPVTPFAVPFKWEEVPGKPKTLHEANQPPPQTNSFPVLVMPPSATKKLSALQSQSVAQHSRSSSGSCGAEEKRVISVEMKRFKESPGSLISSLDLGPPDNAVQKLRKKAASTLVRVWRKTNPEKHRPKPDSVPPVSSCGSLELPTD